MKNLPFLSIIIILFTLSACCTYNNCIKKFADINTQVKDTTIIIPETKVDTLIISKIDYKTDTVTLNNDNLFAQTIIQYDTVNKIKTITLQAKCNEKTITLQTVKTEYVFKEPKQQNHLKQYFIALLIGGMITAIIALYLISKR
jgi:sporulation protein YlmC with PRC-barrel domain